LLPLDQREDFGRVHEGDRTFTDRVEDCEYVDEKRHQSGSGGGVLDEKAHSSSEKRPAHLKSALGHSKGVAFTHVGEGEEQETSATVGVNGK